MNRTCSFCGAVFDSAKATGGVCPECGQWDPDDDWNHEAALAWLAEEGRPAGHEEVGAGVPQLEEQMNAELESLLAQAKAAPPDRKIDFRDPIAKHEEAAIAGVAPWLSDDRLGWFAVRVIEKTTSYGVPKRVAIAALYPALRVEGGVTAKDARDAIVRLGGERPKLPNKWRELGNRQFMPSEKYWHIVDGEIVTDSRHAYLRACGGWASEGWVKQNGGIQKDVPPGGHLCLNCNEVELGGYKTSSTSWKVQTVPAAEGKSVTYLWSDGPRHRATDEQPLESVERGPVYLTRCGLYVVKDRVRVTRHSSVEDDREPCENCWQDSGV